MCLCVQIIICETTALKPFFSTISHPYLCLKSTGLVMEYEIGTDFLKKKGEKYPKCCTPFFA